MIKAEYGDPIVTCRMPRWMIHALRALAKQEVTTQSALIRELVYDLLQREGMVPTQNRKTRA